MAPTPTSAKEYDTTLFPPPLASAALSQALALAQEMKKARKFTDLANFTLKCGVCGVGIKGQTHASNHAKTTGHSEFTEF